MAATRSDQGRRRGLPAPARRLSLRLRLTLLYGGCFLVGSAAVLSITYALVAHDTSGQTHALYISPGKVTKALSPIEHPSSGGARRRASATPGPGRGHVRARDGTVMTLQRIFPAGPLIITFAQPRSATAAHVRTAASGRRLSVTPAVALQKRVNVVVEQANGALTTQRRQSLGALLTWSGVALGVMAVLSILLGWLLAGRALRPLRTMTSRAREITAENLHQRLSVDVREDELGDLATTFDGVLARLQRAFDAQRRFVANASHELRTPVTLERALLEVALADPDADATELRHACERVLASTERQERTIEALLALARSQGGTDVDGPVDLAELAQDAIALREPRLDDITVATDLHPAPLTGDPALLERLVANLIENAIVHNLGHDPWITIETGTEDDQSWLRVSNSGPEITQACISDIFEPFRRIAGERTVTTTGLGLGLSIVQAIADAHEATVEARPVDGGGLQVDVRF